MHPSFRHRLLVPLALACFALVGPGRAAATALAPGQTFVLDGTVPGKVFEGVGAVSGGGGTSVLLKDYPEPQRSQILDLLFKPRFGASMQTLYVEVGSDGNATQGSEPTHMRSRHDQNYRRGYEWWLMVQAKRRNPALTLDACAWGCPGWVGDGHYWSQDMCDYYVNWIKGLKAHYGLDLDAIGCRNERGPHPDWAVRFRRTLDRAGLSRVRLHAFDDPGDARMWAWIPQLASDPALQHAVDIVSNHCLTDVPMPPSVRATLARLHKPVWDTEEHAYNEGGKPPKYADDYACALGIVHQFNLNFIEDGATKIVNWYLVGSIYPIEPYYEQPPAMFASSPWSGHYKLKPNLWAYAHYGQFTKIGWRYVGGGFGRLAGGGSVVTLRSDAGDYSVIVETSGATRPQTVRFRVGSGLSRRALCVWRTTRKGWFTRQADIRPAVDGTFTATFAPDAIYTLSTTRGQRRGSFAHVPPARPFPFPYADNFDHDADPGRWGYLPHYTADICGVFEVVPRPGGTGRCLRQVVSRKVQSWAPEWKPYTVLGNPDWTDYQISADIRFDDGGWAGVMGRISSTGNGWDGDPDGYYARLDADGTCAIYVASQQLPGTHDRPLATGRVPGWKAAGWHHVTLQFEGKRLTLLVDGAAVARAENGEFARGLAGLITGGNGNVRNTALFDNLVINRVGGGPIPQTPFPQDAHPLYGP